MTIRRRTIAILALAGLAGAGCGAKKDLGRDAAPPTADRSLRRAMELIDAHDLRRARETLQRIQFTPTDREELEPLVRLALADATFYQNTSLAWIDARSLYLEFVTLYGDHPLAPYAQLQAGSASLNQANRPSQDQSQTQRAITDLEQVLRRWPGSRYAWPARSLIGLARDRLAESEYLVGRFYLKRKAYGSAIARFRGVLREYPDYAGEDKLLYGLAQSLGRARRPDEAKIYLDQLVADHPNSPWVKPARDLLAELERRDDDAGDSGATTGAAAAPLAAAGRGTP